MTGNDPHPSARTRQTEIEIAAGPEEIWEAITTRDGHAAWLFPADIEPGEGGEMVIHREPFAADATARVTAWEPPHRFAYEEPVQTSGRSDAPLATEFLVEARKGGTCVVRVISGFARDGEGWEDLVEGASEGWRMALIVLRGYLTHFAGRPVAHLDATVRIGRPLADRAQVSATLMALLGLTGLSAGDPFRTPESAPPLAGTVDHVSQGYVLLRVSEPFPALFAISGFPMDDAALSANIAGRLYGTSEAVAAREEARWRSWLSDQAAELAAAP